jgi:eukaryotic-like serine/threonine-protein kinase
LPDWSAREGLGPFIAPGICASILPCALKENLDVSEQAQRQFAREASVLASLRHPNLPRVVDYFSVEGQGQYLVMDYIEGETLEDKVAQHGPVSADQAVAWISQICDALAYLHSQEPPIIHRDVKPGNITITPEGQAMLIDFGAFKVYAPHLKTTVAARVVSPGYAPVEQYGTAATDARTDVYAVGATLYHILSGQEPLESIARLTGTPLPDLASLNGHLDSRLVETIEAAMGIMQDQRLPTIVALKDALLVLSGERPIDNGVEAVTLPEPATIPDKNPDAKVSSTGVAILQTSTTSGNNPHGVKNRNDLGSLYDTARLAYRQNDWQQVKEICLQIETVKPGYLDVSTMLARAKREIGRSSQGAVNHPKSPQLKSDLRQSKTNTKAASSSDDEPAKEDFFSSPFVQDGVLYALGSTTGWAIPAIHYFVSGTYPRWYIDWSFLIVIGFVGLVQSLVLRKYIQDRSWYWLLSWVGAWLPIILLNGLWFTPSLFHEIGGGGVSEFGDYW